MANEFQITGLVELDRALRELPTKIERSILRGALRAGQKEFLQRARAAVPTKSGALRKSLRISTSVRGGKFRSKLTAGNEKAWYAHLVEFGTKRHIIKAGKDGSLAFGGVFRKSVDHPGTQAKPFMRPAFDGGERAAADAFAAYMRQRIERGGLK